MATFREVIAGLEILERTQGGGAHIGGADHDVIYGAPKQIALTDADKAALEKLGWIMSDEYDSWVRFV